MTAMSQLSEEDAKLASQCLDICQTLAGKSLPFSFSFNIGPNFSFSVDTRGKEVSTPQKKKKTPSTLRRDARRREELLRKKLNAPTAEKAFMCDHCENTFKSENGLKIHIGKSHKKVDSTPATPDRLRQQTNSFVSLSASPLLDTSREESSSISPVSEDATKSTSTHLCYEEPFNCNFCKEVFNCEDKLARHKTSGCKQQFVCQICGVVFDLEGALRHKSDCPG